MIGFRSSAGSIVTSTHDVLFERRVLGPQLRQRALEVCRFVVGGRQQTLQSQRGIETVMTRVSVGVLFPLSEDVVFEPVRDHCR